MFLGKGLQASETRLGEDSGSGSKPRRPKGSAMSLAVLGSCSRSSLWRMFSACSGLRALARFFFRELNGMKIGRRRKLLGVLEGVGAGWSTTSAEERVLGLNGDDRRAILVVN